jgi:hypothetical protein
VSVSGSGELAEPRTEAGGGLRGVQLKLPLLTFREFIGEACTVRGLVKPNFLISYISGSWELMQQKLSSNGCVVGYGCA